MNHETADLVAAEPFADETSAATRREAGRLAALEAIDILDTPSEVPFERIARMVQKMLRVPAAALTFIDGNRQWSRRRSAIAIARFREASPSAT